MQQNNLQIDEIRPQNVKNVNYVDNIQYNRTNITRENVIKINNLLYAKINNIKEDINNNDYSPQQFAEACDKFFSSKSEVQNQILNDIARQLHMESSYLSGFMNKSFCRQYKLPAKSLNYFLKRDIIVIILSNFQHFAEIQFDKCVDELTKTLQEIYIKHFPLYEYDFRHQIGNILKNPKKQFYDLIMKINRQTVNEFAKDYNYALDSQQPSEILACINKYYQKIINQYQKLTKQDKIDNEYTKMLKDIQKQVNQFGTIGFSTTNKENNCVYISRDYLFYPIKYTPTEKQESYSTGIYNNIKMPLLNKYFSEDNTFGPVDQKGITGQVIVLDL